MSAVSQIQELARRTIDRWLAELRGEGGPAAAAGRFRRSDGGRKALVVMDATLRSDLEGLLEPTTPGDPMAPLRWPAKSQRKMAAGLRGLGRGICHNVVADPLREMGYGLAVC